MAGNVTLKDFLKIAMDNMDFEVHNGTPWHENEVVYDSRHKQDLSEELLQKEVVYLFIDDNKLIVEID